MSDRSARPSNATDDALREEVRERYAAAARVVLGGGGCGCGDAPIRDEESRTSACCGGTGTAHGGEGSSSCCGDAGAAEVFGPALYAEVDRGDLPAEAVAASLGCGNPTAVAELHEGDAVLDLGSGGGIDVLLSAKRVGPTGMAYGLDMTDEMLDLARGNAERAGARNVTFLKGHIEAVPLPDGCVDVVISNCVVNLSTDKPAVFAEMYRVLRDGGRIGVSDVVADDRLTPADRAARGSHTACIGGALSKSEYERGLVAVGFADVSVTFTHEVADGTHGAIIRATKPTR